MPHQHRVQSEQDFGWATCITPDACAARPQRQAAHGGIVIVQRCSCGAQRQVETNNGSRNVGPWVDAETRSERISRLGIAGATAGENWW